MSALCGAIMGVSPRPRTRSASGRGRGVRPAQGRGEADPQRPRWLVLVPDANEEGMEVRLLGRPEHLDRAGAGGDDLAIRERDQRSGYWDRSLSRAAQ